MYYLPSALRTVNATVENDPMPHISGNTRHSVSIQYEFPNLTLRAGVNNLTNKGPSFPTRNYGDLYGRSEEHTSELQSLMRISYAVFCLKNKNIRFISILYVRNYASHTHTTHTPFVT